MKKLLVGCGIAVVVTLLLLVGAGVFVTRWVQDRMPDMERLGEYESTLVERHGEADAWTPPLDGVYEMERVARFVQIRQALRPAHERMAARFDELVAPDKPQTKGLRGMIGGARAVVTALSGGMELLVLADSLLIASDMGKGEFAHYNLLTVHGVQAVSIDRSVDELRERGDQDDAREAMLEMLEEYESESRALLRAHIDNVLRELGTRESGPESAAWRDLLRDARESTTVALPLTDPVPPGFLAALAPWQSTLELQRPQSLGELLAQLPFVLRSEDQKSGSVGFRF